MWQRSLTKLDILKQDGADPLITGVKMEYFKSVSA